MARQLRIEFEGAFYHVTSRGNQRERIFWNDRDREELKKIIKRTKERYKYLVHAYVFMDNHYHLLIETPHANIKQVMQNINTSYTVYVNRKHKRAGHLFQGRYKAFIVDKESYLLELSRYIHLNPVRAGLVERLEDYKWSSYREYIYGRNGESITDTEDTLYSFSKKCAIAARKYHDFVTAGIRVESPFKNSSGYLLGGERFREKIKKYLVGIRDKVEISDIKKIEPRHKITDVVREVAKYYRINERELLKRKRATAKQRKVAIYFSKVSSGSKNVEVGSTFGITAQAVTNALRDIEKRMEESVKFRKEITMIKNSFN
ncbi:MAG: transposase [Thermodesulfovibrionales bacterium]